jgi:hypothetical protein
MWFSQLWSAKTLDSVRQVARLKLIRKDKLGGKDDDHVLAVFAHRIGLEIGPGKASSLVAAKAVRSHMRILLEVPDHSIVRTHSPSEPILSVAACELLNSDQKTYIEAVNTLTKLLTVRKVIVETGRQGALFLRLLLTLPRDWETCFRDKSGKPRAYIDNSGPYRVHVITLRQLLETLLGEDKVEEQKGLGKYTETVYVNFTHFHRLREVMLDVSSDFLRNAWERGVAFQVSHNQDLFDVMIVTYSGSLTEPWDNSKLGTFCIQGKFRKQADGQSVLDQLVGPTVNGKRPEREVVILMDLGTTTPFRTTKDHISSAYSKVVRPEKTVPGGYSPDQERERWCIAVRGHTSKEYPVLTAFGSQVGQALESALQSQTQATFTDLLKPSEKHLDSELEPNEFDKTSANCESYTTCPPL